MYVHEPFRFVQYEYEDGFDENRHLERVKIYASHSISMTDKYSAEKKRFYIQLISDV